ncbi:unnamed protein product, partial [Staurois parvus]
MAVLCTAIQSSAYKLTGRRTVLFTNSSPPHQRCSAITVRQRVITGQDLVIDSHEWRH